MRYKFRAECSYDANRFHRENIRNITSITITKAGVIEVEVEVTTDLDIECVKDRMRKIPDGHIMWQTIKPTAEYTGMREYN